MPPIVTHIHSKPAPQKMMEARAMINIIAHQGISGDASFGRTKRQILIISESVLAQHKLQPGDLRENLVVKGLDIDALPVGTELSIGNTKLILTSHCDPCSRLDEIQPGLQIKLKGQRGMLARALSNGQISVGDPVEIFLTHA